MLNKLSYSWNRISLCSTCDVTYGHEEKLNSFRETKAAKIHHLPYNSFKLLVTHFNFTHAVLLIFEFIAIFCYIVIYILLRWTLLNSNTENDGDNYLYTWFLIWKYDTTETLNWEDIMSIFFMMTYIYTDRRNDEYIHHVKRFAFTYSSIPIYNSIIHVSS